MPLIVEWQDIALRLALTVLAGGLIGFNRGEHGRPAGIRTTILVCLAASAAMIQVNLLLGLSGRKPDSFVMNDLMRLPLGILSGMGFIGGGAILRRDNMVVGVTTAATLWFVTVLGLCFGGGQLGLGSALLAIGMFVLWNLKWLEQHIRQDRRAMLVLVVDSDAPPEETLRAKLIEAGLGVHSCAVTYAVRPRLRRLSFEVSWRSRPDELHTPAIVAQLATGAGVRKIDWQP